MESTTIYFDGKDNYAIQIEEVIEVFEHTIHNQIFSENKATQETLLQDIINTIEPSFACPESAYEHAIDKFNLREKIQYQYLCMTVSLLYHIFEQQIRQVFHNELTKHGRFIDEKSGMDYSSSHFNDDYRHANGCLKLIVNEWWNHSKLEECRLVNNAIKHGTGYSLDQLKQKFPQRISSKYSEKYKIFDSIEFQREIDNTILEGVIDLNISDLKEYSEALVDFWRSAPYQVEIKVGSSNK